jgi:hypothetical protein
MYGTTQLRVTEVMKETDLRVWKSGEKRKRMGKEWAGMFDHPLVGMFVEGRRKDMEVLG